MAFIDKPGPTAKWDNFQCKHYDHSLRPSDVWIELGKLMYYTHTKQYTKPENYYFVAPQDVGTSLARLFHTPDALRTKLYANWAKYCQDSITKKPVTLTARLKKHIDSYPFDSISFKPVLSVLREHAGTRWHVHRFGGGLPNRPDAPDPPSQLAPSELPYVAELLKAYGDHKKTPIASPVDLTSWGNLDSHFQLSRKSFYSAESLKEFSRDHLPDGEYERLQDEICDGVQESYLEAHDDGYRRAVATTQAAVQLAITSHPLLSVLRSPDRRGVCHQLVNDLRLKWVD
ncbi:ABC-three component system protein [Posidoniimonas corsicana]|nr:ABC-three component system protein [Posidoniimonas corsicana]